MRRQMGDTLSELVLADPRLVLILADISTGYVEEARVAAPDRVLNLGIMEQAAVSVAAGFALEGFIPVFHSITPFAVERPFEQWKDDFGYQGLGGNVISIGASYDYGTDGATHHAPGDVQALLAIPAMEIVLPGTAVEFDTLFREAYADGAPTYFRLSMQPNATDRPVQFGRLERIRQGAAGTVIAVGPMLDRVVAAAEGLDLAIAYATTLVPFDVGGLRAISQPDARGVHRIAVVEPFWEGTLTETVAAALRPDPVQIQPIGMARQVLSRYGAPEEHDAALGLDQAGIRRRLETFAAG